MTLSLSEILEGIPPSPGTSAVQVREARAQAQDSRIYVVLDDDPTGTQSVADLPVLTAWEPQDFTWAFAQEKPAVYVMTNSRSLSPADAERVNREVVSAALSAAATTGTQLAFVSRSDSTLRGHFPLEPLTIIDEMRKSGGAEPGAGASEVDGIILVPAFGDAGRITVHGVHYAGSEKTGFVPVGETEFAKDASFGYQASRLPQWVEEKTGGQVPASDVVVLELGDLRADLDKIVSQLLAAHDGTVLAADIVTEEDLRQLSLALIKAETTGKHFVYRVGPPFVRARIGQDEHAPLTDAEIASARGNRELAPGGLIVVGSHVDLTTRQLAYLREQEQLPEFEIEVPQVIDSVRREAHLAEIVDKVKTALGQGNAIVRTSRQLVTGADEDDSLAISRQVSAAVVAVTQQVLRACPPRFVVAKGGITSSDTASKGLSIRRAKVVGPMLPGIVSLWTALEGPAQGIPYIVFAGNVGDVTSLAAVVQKLSK